MHDGFPTKDGNQKSSSRPPLASSSVPSSQVAREHERSVLKPSNSRGSTSSSTASSDDSSMVTCSPPPESSSDSGSSGQSPTSGSAIYFPPPGGQSTTTPISRADSRPLIPRPQKSQLRPGLSSKDNRVLLEPCIVQKPIYPFAPSYIRSSSRHNTSLLPLIPPYSSTHSVSSSQRSYSTSTLDSKYPSALHMPELGLITYDSQFDDDDDDEGQMNEPGEKVVHIHGKSYVSWRGLLNLLSLFALIGGIIALFVIYPVFAFYRESDRNSAIVNNPNINATGQAEEPASIGSRDQLLLTKYVGDTM